LSAVIRMTPEEYERHQARVKGATGRECPEQPKAKPVNEITLPWPSKELSPNARCHWSVRHHHAKAYRDKCRDIAATSGLVIDWEGVIHLWITFFPPDRRGRDDDNMLAALKSGRDGISDGLGVNDLRFRVHPWVSDEVVKGGKVVIRFSKGPGEGK